MSVFGGQIGERFLAEVTKQCDIGGVSARAQIRVENTYKTTIDFSVRERTYTFVITRWQSAGFSNFFQMFHAHQPREASVFGRVDFDDEDMPAFYASVEHKTHAVIRASEDIMRCLNLILSTHGRGVLDYAVWYREKHASYETYGKLITTLTCHCIVHADFLAPSVQWCLVEFA